MVERNDSEPLVITGEEAEDHLRKKSRKITGEDVETVVEKAEEIKKMARGPLARLLADLKTLTSLVKDYWNTSYTQVPWWTIASATAALLYVLNPMDIVPDFIPFFGLLDDAAIVSACLFMIERDLVKYRKWKNEYGAGDEPLNR
jgi:uncharacterized membrane protein YkvA (DUF1232 family)